MRKMDIKKKVCVLVTGVMMACALVACGKEAKDETTVDSTNPVQADLVEFINDELPGIATDKDKALTIYNSYFSGGDMDNAAFVNDLKSNAVPAMETYIANLSAIKVKTSEVEEIKQLYLMGVQKQYEAMKMVVNAIEGEMPEYLTQAEALIVEAQTYMKDYEQKVIELANNNQITVTGDIVSSGETEEAATQGAVEEATIQDAVEEVTTQEEQ